MSIDAIAALLGHTTLARTVIYAERMADKAEAEEYFNVTEKVEALNGRPQATRADEDRETRKRRGGCTGA